MEKSKKVFDAKKKEEGQVKKVEPKIEKKDIKRLFHSVVERIKKEKEKYSKDIETCSICGSKNRLSYFGFIPFTPR